MLSKRAVDRFESRLSARGASLNVWSVLRELAECGPVSQRELADRLLLKGPSLVPRLDALEEAGSPGGRPTRTTAASSGSRSPMPAGRCSASSPCTPTRTSPS